MRVGLLALVACALLSAQTETLDRLFAERNYIELAAALSASANLSPEQTAFYRGLLANRRNAAADSIASLQIALPVLEAANDQAHLKVAYYILADDYSKTFRYADAASVYRKIDRRFSASLPRKERQDVRDSLRKWESLSRAEPQTVRSDQSFVINRTRDEAGILTVPARFQDQTVPCVFDTGANYSVLTLSLAKALGLSLSEATIPVDAITGGEVAARLAVVPEFRLGAAVVKNAIFLIFEDRDLYIAPIKHQIRGIIGFPVIAALGRLTFQKNGEIEIGAANTTDAGAPNFYLEERTPLVAAATDGKPKIPFFSRRPAAGLFFSFAPKNQSFSSSLFPPPQKSTSRGAPTPANLVIKSLWGRNSEKKPAPQPRARLYREARHRPRFFLRQSRPGCAEAVRPLHAGLPEYAAGIGVTALGRFMQLWQAPSSRPAIAA